MTYPNKCILLLCLAIGFSSCLKQSIPDAMLAQQESSLGPTATMSYSVNGNPVTISVPQADAQNPASYMLGCSKTTYYSLDGIATTGECAFNFYTDSLTKGHYVFGGVYGADMFFISYNGSNEYAHAATDSMVYNITSYVKGHISGNFSGVLTPLLSSGPITNTFGTSSSVKITNGKFQNVPVFY